MLTSSPPRSNFGMKFVRGEMKKTFIIFSIVLVLFCLAGCKQYVFVPGDMFPPPWVDDDNNSKPEVNVEISASGYFSPEADGMFSIPYTDENGIRNVASLPRPSSINEYGVGTFRINGIDIELQIADEVISDEEDFRAFVSYKTSRSASETRVAVIAEDIDVAPVLISQPDIVLTSLSEATITIKHSGETNTDSISGQALFYISADNVRISRLNIEADASENPWDDKIRLMKISDTFGEDGIYDEINSTVLSDVSLNSNGKTGPLLDMNNTKDVVLKNVTFSGNSNYYSYVTITKSLNFIFDGITLPAPESINFTYNANDSEYFFSSGTFSNVASVPFITWDSELFTSEKSFDDVKSRLSGLDAFIDDSITASDLDVSDSGSFAYHILYNKNISNEYLTTYRPALIAAIKAAITDMFEF